MKYLLIFCSILLLQGCAGTRFAWESDFHSTSVERERDAQYQEGLVEQQLRHQLSDGSLSQADYNNLIKANRDYANSIK